MFTPPLNANLNRLSQRTSVRRAVHCVATHTVLRRMCVSGPAGAVDGLREAVLRTEQQQWHQLSGALQHPAPGKQPDPVRLLYSKQKKLHTVIKIIGHGSVFYRFGLLPLSMSNVRKPKSSSRVSSHPPVSITTGVRCFSIYTLTKHHISSFSLSVQFYVNYVCCLLSCFELENTRQVHLCVYVGCVCVCVLKCDCFDSNRWKLFSEVDWI